MGVPFTTGFDPGDLPDHFARHGPDYGATNAQVYEQMADTFFGSPKGATVLECIRRRGDLVRFNPQTCEFGVMGATRILRTYYIKLNLRQRSYADKLAFFQVKCQRF